MLCHEGMVPAWQQAAVQDAENRFMRKIMVVPRKEYHLEQFDLQGK